MRAALFPLTVLLSAAAALATEIAIVRIGAPYVGQSLIPWSAAITSVLIGLMVGHMLGGTLGGSQAPVARLRSVLGIAWLGGGIMALMMPGGVAWLAQHGWFGDDDFWRAPIAVATLALPPSIAAGTVSPLAIRICGLQASDARARVISRIYAAGAAGSILGTALAGFVLLDWIGSAGLASAIACVWFALAAAIAPWRRSVRIALLAAGLAGAVFVGRMTPCQIESRYTCIRLLDRELADGGLLRFMLLDEGVHSASDRDHPRRLHLGYAALADRLAAAAWATSASPRAIVIGGGGNTLSRAWAAADQPVAVLAIEIDEKVATAAAARMWAEPSAHLVTRIGDGRVLLRTAAPGSEQVILMDAYRSRAVPPHLVSREFNRLVNLRLSPRGLFLSNVIDRGRAPQLAASVAETLARDFAAVDLWVPDKIVDGALTNIVVAAWKDAEGAFRPPQLQVDATVLPPGGPAHASVSQWRRIDVRDIDREWPRLCRIILTDDRAPVERLLYGGVRCTISAASFAN